MGRVHIAVQPALLIVVGSSLCFPLGLAVCLKERLVTGAIALGLLGALGVSFACAWSVLAAFPIPYAPAFALGLANVLAGSCGLRLLLWRDRTAPRALVGAGFAAVDTSIVALLAFLTVVSPQPISIAPVAVTAVAVALQTGLVVAASRS